MTEDQQAIRRQRLRQALRDNLKRRKAQAKGRAVGSSQTPQQPAGSDDVTDLTKESTVERRDPRRQT